MKLEHIVDQLKQALADDESPYDPHNDNEIDRAVSAILDGRQDGIFRLPVGSLSLIAELERWVVLDFRVLPTLMAGLAVRVRTTEASHGQGLATDCAVISIILGHNKSRDRHWFVDPLAGADVQARWNPYDVNHRALTAFQYAADSLQDLSRKIEKVRKECDDEAYERRVRDLLGEAAE